MDRPMIWTRTPPIEAEIRRVLVWPEGDDPEPVSREEREALPPDAQVPGCRLDQITGEIHPGWYGPTTTSFGPRAGVWYRSTADAVQAARRQILRRAAIELLYCERVLTQAQESPNPDETA